MEINMRPWVKAIQMQEVRLAEIWKRQCMGWQKGASPTYQQAICKGRGEAGRNKEGWCMGWQKGGSPIYYKVIQGLANWCQIYRTTGISVNHVHCHCCHLDRLTWQWTSSLLLILKVYRRLIDLSLNKYGWNKSVNCILLSWTLELWIKNHSPQHLWIWLQ